jgi:hypothetical protein
MTFGVFLTDHNNISLEFCEKIRSWMEDVEGKREKMMT